MNNNQLIALALQNDFDAELAMYDGMPEHRFSLRFRRRMRKLLGGGVSEWETKRVPLRKAVTFAIITVILLAFLTGATLLIYKMWDKFQLHDVGEHSFLVALDYIVHTLVEAAVFWNGFQGFLDYYVNVIGNESKRIHGTNVDSTIPSIAIIHDMTDFV